MLLLVSKYLVNEVFVGLLVVSIISKLISDEMYRRY